MDPFYIAAFVASSELNDLSQNASNVNTGKKVSNATDNYNGLLLQ